MTQSEDTVRAAFRLQAEFCHRLRSPFTALLCQVIAGRLTARIPLGARILGWSGQPDALGDSVPLRLAGGLHALVRRGRVPALAAHYPPHPLPDPDTLWAVLEPVLADEHAELLRWLDSPPQTNEVARAAVLMAGLLVVADRVRRPLALYELGCSAGLNLVLDRYGYRLGARSAGTAGAALLLGPEWQGPPPPQADIVIHAARGVDIRPLDVTDPADRERLLAYVWPDQPERLERIAKAIAIAATAPPAIDVADAADWLDRMFAAEPKPGVGRVVTHTIAFQYFPLRTQERITDRIARAGAEATADTPFAWLRFESDPDSSVFSLRLNLWPGGMDAVLATGDPHGRQLRWLLPT